MSRWAVEDILRKCECGPYEKLVLMCIASHGRGTDGSGGHPSATTIAKETGIDRSTVFRVLGSLRDKGWLSWTPGSAKKNTANTYKIYFDALPIPSRTEPLPSPTERLPSRTKPLGPSRTARLGLVARRHKPSRTVRLQASTEANTSVRLPRSGRQKVRSPNGEPKGAASAKGQKRPLTSGPRQTGSSPSQRKAPPEDGDISIEALEWYRAKWNEHCPPLTSVPNLGARRVMRLRHVIGLGELTPNDFIAAIAKIKLSPYLLGKNRKHWQASFDFLIAEGALTKVIEGNYDLPEPAGHRQTIH